MTFGSLTFSGNRAGWPPASRFAVLWQKLGGQWKTLFDTGIVPFDRGPDVSKAQ